MNNNIKTTENEKIVSKSALEIATEYYLKGWQPIPIPTRSKNPNFAGWSVQHTNGGSLKSHPENNLSQRFYGDNGKPQNIGVLLGEPSNFLVDIDLDNFWSVQLAAYFCPKQMPFSDAKVSVEVITFIIVWKPKRKNFNSPK